MRRPVIISTLRAWFRAFAGWVWAAERRTLRAAALTGATLTVLLGCLTLGSCGGPLVNVSYDLPFKIHRAGAAAKVALVYIDEFAGGRLDRTQQAVLLDKLRAAGAKAVLYDIIFDDTSSDPNVDEAFAAAMLRFRGVDAEGKSVPGQTRRHIFLACGRKSLSVTGIVVERLIPPTDLLLNAADDFGLVALLTADCFTVRELTTGTADESSMTWKAAATLGAKLDESTRLEARWINYAGEPEITFRSCTAQSVLTGVTPDFLHDRVVIVGGAPGVAGEALGQDLFNTPFNSFDSRGTMPRMSGPELQANVLTNLLRGNWLTRSTRSFDAWFILLTGILAGAGLAYLRPALAVVVALAGIAGLTWAGVMAVYSRQWWFPWSVAALVQLPFAFVWCVAARFYVQRYFQRLLRDSFSKYVSPQMLDRLTAEGFTMKLGGDKVMAAMMFTDIESFTEMCQRVRHPERIVKTLNDYFRRTTGHIFDHDGVIIKFIGDAIFAAWGAPLADPDAPRKAVRAAWKLSQSDQLTVDGEELKTRIGVHFGEVVAGNIGTDYHVDYTLIGDAVNLASRLEGLNKVLDTHILISDTVAPHLGSEFRTRRVGKFKVKGRRDTTEVHELLGPALQEEEPEWVTAYHEALAALESGDHPAARKLFESTIATRSRHGDGPSRFFLECLDKGDTLAGGVVDMKEK